jgi:hypothetical protein
MIIPAGIHRGEVTHHHDQEATTPTPANLRYRKIRKMKPPRPMPLFAELD